MDFNTGSQSEEPEGTSQELGSGSRTRSGGGGEFTYTDPIQSYVNTVRDLVTRPADFFSGIARRGDFVNPLIFALIGVVVTAVIGGFLGILGAILGIGSRGVGGAFASLIGSILLLPILYTIVLFIGAGILHLLVMLIVKPATTGYEATFRVLSYSYVGQLVAWVPFLGPLVAAVATVVIIGVREVHSTTTGKAALVVLIPLAVVLILLLVLAAVLGAVIFTILQQQM
jgi:hypothetical protein